MPCLPDAVVELEECRSEKKTSSLDRHIWGFESDKEGFLGDVELAIRKPLTLEEETALGKFQLYLRCEKDITPSDDWIQMLGEAYKWMFDTGSQWSKYVLRVLGEAKIGARCAERLDEHMAKMCAKENYDPNACDASEDWATVYATLGKK